MEKQDSIRQLGEMIKGIKFAMLTTIDGQGHLRSRPMATEQVEFNGDLWFVTRDDSPKVHELENDHRVNLSYADAHNHKFVSVSGRAGIVHDRAKLEQLWSPLFKTWFPKGIDDPNIALLKVTAEQAEYWDQPSGGMKVLFDFVRAAVTGKPARESTEVHKLNLTGY